MMVRTWFLLSYRFAGNRTSSQNYQKAEMRAPGIYSNGIAFYFADGAGKSCLAGRFISR